MTIIGMKYFLIKLYSMKHLDSVHKDVKDWNINVFRNTLGIHYNRDLKCKKY